MIKNGRITSTMLGRERGPRHFNVYDLCVIQCEHFYMCQNVRKSLIEKMKDLGEI